MASVVSMAMFTALLHSMPGAPGAGGARLMVSLIDAHAATALDASQRVELTAPVIADSVREQQTAMGRQGDDGGDGYLPASRLTEPPQVIRDIDPEWRLPGIQLPVLVGMLLINEYGDVDRVLLDEQTLSPMLVEDIQSRFLAMRFSPGRLQGISVKTALRIEIRLDEL